MVSLVIAVILAYISGSLPFGLWVGKWARGIDIREHGSGNLGATNAFRVLGRNLGILVLCLDILKGMLPVLLFPRILGFEPTPGEEVLIGLSAIVGHVLSFFVNFKGGKGVATALGVFLAIAPMEMGIALGIGVVLITVFGYVSLASVTGAVLLPILMLWNGRPGIVLLVTTLISVVVVIRHKSNIIRLLKGEENRIYPTKNSVVSADIPKSSPDSGEKNP